MTEPKPKPDKVRTAMVLATPWSRLSKAIDTLKEKMLTRKGDGKKTGAFHCDLFVVVVDHKNLTTNELQTKLDDLTDEYWANVKTVISPKRFENFSKLSRRKQYFDLAEYLAGELIPRVIRTASPMKVGLIWDPSWVPWIAAGSAVSTALPRVSWWNPPAMPDAGLLPGINISRSFRDYATTGDTTLLGESDAIEMVRQRLELFAPLPFPVLLIGETGTGKELCARILHERSDRSGSLASINGAMLDPALAASDLFGHKKGAFTGADRERRGRIREAEGGTFFLDEISSVPIATQSKLLRALQDVEDERILIEPVGSQEGKMIQARFVSALQRDPLEHGDLREDLYYRIAGLPLDLPPLRERGDDVILLAHVFLKHLSDTLGEGPIRISRDVEAMFRDYLWPGNVRELEQVIRMAWVLANGRHAGGLAAKDLPRRFFSPGKAAPVGASLKEKVALLVRREAEAALEKHSGDKTAAGKELGFERGQSFERYVTSQTKHLPEESS